ncbi:hypothetical protein Plec18167_002606 [Paecilomyces lecythidis]|uniref:Acyl-coenzyme A diphosphatase SCS3 n=1 Tax=Paecilomyces lecythidis TaxID=3004212 RepID=A0ABR3Y5P4_9EURO
MASPATSARRNGSPSATALRGSSPVSQPPGLILLVYPITLIVGALYKTISPTARDASIEKPLAPTLASDLNVPQHTSSVNYFARKNNIFNLYFVKIGWLWTTLAFVALLLTQPAYTNSRARGRKTVQALARYGIVTLAWILTTQWFFGPAIVDRSFVLTGGRCEDVRPRTPGDPASELNAVFTAAACKAAGGAWRGGHDVSGHVFMLVLASAFLVFEVWGASKAESGTIVEGSKAKQDTEEPSEQETGVNSDDPIKVWGLRFACGVAGLSWWMLFMTAIWFHTWLEKISGLSIALGAVYITYFLPRILPPWRDVVGFPGV